MSGRVKSPTEKENQISDVHAMIICPFPVRFQKWIEKGFEAVMETELLDKRELAAKSHACL